MDENNLNNLDLRLNKNILNLLIKNHNLSKL